MESRGPEDSKNVKTSQAYFFEGFISFFEDFSLTRWQPEQYFYLKACFLTPSLQHMLTSLRDSSYVILSIVSYRPGAIEFKGQVS